VQVESRALAGGVHVTQEETGNAEFDVIGIPLIVRMEARVWFVQRDERKNPPGDDKCC
jgi:hypothetical protein